MRPTTANKSLPRTALIDADGLLYAAALKGEVSCDGEQLQMLTAEQAYKDACQRIEEIARKVGAEKVWVILSDRRNFRTDILPSYKGQRKTSTRPLLLDALRAMFVDDSPYTVMLIEGLEADDVCGIAMGTLQKAGISEPCIVSPDKDLLQIPGLVFTPVSGKMVRTEVTQESGDRFHFYQMLAGDQVDNYKGLPGYGATRAGIFLDTCEEAGLSPAETWEEIVKLYEEKGLTVDDALTQARVSRILRASDWDPVKKEPILWTPPLTDR